MHDHENCICYNKKEEIVQREQTVYPIETGQIYIPDVKELVEQILSNEKELEQIPLIKPHKIPIELENIPEPPDNITVRTEKEISICFNKKTILAVGGAIAIVILSIFIGKVFEKNSDSFGHFGISFGDFKLDIDFD